MLYEIKVAYDADMFNVKMIHEAIEFVLSSCPKYTILGTVYMDDATYTLVSSQTGIVFNSNTYCYTKAPTYENRAFIPINYSVEIYVYEAYDEFLHKYDLKGSK